MLNIILVKGPNNPTMRISDEELELSRKVEFEWELRISELLAEIEGIEFDYYEVNDDTLIEDELNYVYLLSASSIYFEMPAPFGYSNNVNDIMDMTDKLIERCMNRNFKPLKFGIDDFAFSARREVMKQKIRQRALILGEGLSLRS